MEELEPRVQRLENNHNLLVAELHQINKTLSKMEQTLEKFTEIITKLSVLEEKVHNNSDKITALEENQSKGMWAIVILVLGAIGNIIFQVGDK